MKKQWTPEQANQWYDRQPWRVGCDYIPHTAINQLEMWQAETFDPFTIDRELGWAEDIGFNTLRVYLHDLLWEIDRAGFLARMDAFLTIAARHGICPLFVFFDDCWNPNPRPGWQPAPVPGMHNSGWLQSPGEAGYADPAHWSRLEAYVTGVLRHFGGDERILAWDLYNEPGNSGRGEKSLPLLTETFAWAWSVRPAQPLTCGVWCDNEALNRFQIESSDVLSFHHYGEPAGLEEMIARLKPHGRPLLCTEYMARPRGCTFQTHLPILQRERIAAINWGFVSGKTQTIFPWGSPAGAPEPAVWFHDIFRPDGTPFDAAEVDFIQHMLGVKGSG